MKIYIAKYEKGRIGGGWSFMDNFAKGFKDDITHDLQDADIFFICSPSMVNREEVQEAKNMGKKIVLRIDNAVRNSRNRNTGMSRMKDFYDWADLVVFQSQWALEYLRPFLGLSTYRNPKVILNGVDLNDYHGNHHNARNNILYSRFNRDETKNWEVARYWYSKYQLTNPDAKLYIAGQFSPELRESNFDFYNGERFEFVGVLGKDSMARMYSVSNLLYTYFNDACSNTLIEALVSGCKIVGDRYYRKTGGAFEILDMFESLGRDYFSIERMCDQYREAMVEL